MARGSDGVSSQVSHLEDALHVIYLESTLYQRSVII